MVRVWNRVILLVGLFLAMVGAVEADPVGAVSTGAGNGSPGVADGSWHMPVDAAIVDFFRDPVNPYGPGNRGLEFKTGGGEVVRAVDDGTVVFAGQVGGRLFVVVSHNPELRSTYAYLDRIDVEVGDHVGRGEPVARAGAGFHLTARWHGRYIDPLPLLGLDLRVRLIAGARSSGLALAAAPAPGAGLAPESGRREGGRRPPRAL